jgi:hypothetical protein
MELVDYVREMLLVIIRVDVHHRNRNPNQYPTTSIPSYRCLELIVFVTR